MIDAGSEVHDRTPVLHSEAVDFETHAHTEAGHAAQVSHAEFLALQVVVAQAQAEVIFSSKQKLAVENEVAGEIIEKAVVVCRGFITEKEDVFL